MKQTVTIIALILTVFIVGQVQSQGEMFLENFETGTASSDWGVFFANEDMLAAVSMNNAPEPLATGGDYVGHLQDIDGTYTGVALATAGEPSMQNYYIEADVYCYANHPGGSAYTGLVVYADSTVDTYIKLVADFDGNQRFRLYNNHLDMTTFQYSFHHQFGADDVPGGIPATDGWHHMKVEVRTLNQDTTAFWCYFDGQMLAGCPIYDTSDDRIGSGQFGVFSFQQGAAGIPGYYDNIVVKPLPEVIFNDNFEAGSAKPDWGVFFANEDNLAAVSMNDAPASLATGGDYVGHLQDSDGTYTGVALATAGETSMQNYSIEADVYCYANHSGGSAYTGLVVYADSSVDTYIKLVADFDGNQRFRLYNNHLDMTTFQYSFHHQFGADDVPGGIPATDGWHHMKVEVRTLNQDTTAFWCYFDGQMLAGCPIYDTSDDRIGAGQFGVFSFQQGATGIPGYYDNIIVKGFGPVTSVEDRPEFETAVVPQSSRLEQNYPNPFNPETHITYEVQSTEFVKLSVHDLLGRNVKTIVSEIKSPGYYTVSWDGRNDTGEKMVSGVYIYTLQTKSYYESRKMLMVK